MATTTLPETSAEKARRHIQTAMRLSEVCYQAMRGLDVESSEDIAGTLGHEQQAALQEALYALELAESEDDGDKADESDDASRSELIDVIDDLNLRHSYAISTLAVLITDTEDHCLSNVLGSVQSHIMSARDSVKKLEDWRKAEGEQ